MTAKNASEKTQANPTVSRRDILKTAWAALGGLVALEMGGLALAYMQPRLAEGEFGGVVTVGKLEDFPPGSVTHMPNGRFYLVRLADGGLLALYQRCTHLGCSVPWDQTRTSLSARAIILSSPFRGRCSTRRRRARWICSRFISKMG